MRKGLSGFSATVCVLVGALSTLGQVSLASPLKVKLTAEKEMLQVVHDGRLIDVRRDQDGDNLVDPMWAKTSRQCPPFCIEPRTPVPGVELVTEVEVFDFMEKRVNTNKGFLIDARLPDWHLRGTIPGSINIPFTVFQRDPNDPKFVKAFEMLGVKPRGEVGQFTRLVDGMFGNGDKTEKWDFSTAKEIILWCNGPWCGQSPHAIRALVKQGYPVAKIHYYRGGMQMWQILGLTTVIPEPESMLFADAAGGE